jgi:hypothetical protein
MPKLNLPTKEAMVDLNDRRHRLITPTWERFWRQVLAILDSGIINLFPSSTPNGVITTDAGGNPVTSATLPLANLPNHATRHQSGGSDPIKLDDLATPDDNTDLNASTTRHGLLLKLSGLATQVLKGNGAWGSVALTTDVTGILPVANGGSGIATGASIHFRDVTYNDAAIKAWPTTALVAALAPGAGRRVIPLWVSVELDSTAGAYTNIHADAYLNPHTADWSIDIFAYMVNGNGTGQTDVNGFLGAAHKREWRPTAYVLGNTSRPQFDADWGAVAPIVPYAASVNQAFIIGLDNDAAGDLTGGHALNTARVRCLYLDVPA